MSDTNVIRAPNATRAKELAMERGAPYGTRWLQEALGLQSMMVQRIVVVAEHGSYTRILVQHGGPWGDATAQVQAFIDAIESVPDNVLDLDGPCLKEREGVVATSGDLFTTTGLPIWRDALNRAALAAWRALLDMTDAELQTIVEAASLVTTTNCWYVTHAAAAGMAALARMMLSDRAYRAERKALKEVEG